MPNPELHAKVEKWLDSQGYPLEMEFAEALSKNGFDIIQSYHFKDPEDGNIRETDIVARYSDPIGLIELHFVIECKKSKSPWVVFSSSSTGFNRLRSFAHMTKVARDAVIDEITEMVNLPWFKKPNRIGYETVQALKSGKDSSYSALMSATKGAMEYFKEETKDVESSFSFVFPLVIFEGVLYESFLDDSAKPKLVEVNSSYVNFNVPIGQVYGKSVRLITRNHIQNLIDEIKTMHIFFQYTLAKQLKQSNEKLYSAMIELERKGV
jgi:hypothetical protein